MHSLVNIFTVKMLANILIHNCDFQRCDLTSFMYLIYHKGDESIWKLELSFL